MAIFTVDTRPGGDGYYRSFDGVNDYIELPNTITFTGDFSVIVTQKTSSSQAYLQLLRKDGNLSPRKLASFQIKDGKLRWQIYDNGTTTNLYGTNTVNDGEIRTVSFVRDGTSGKIFDGSNIDNSGTIVANDVDNSGNVNIGRDPYGDSAYFNGNIHEVRISSVARSDAWIKATSASLSDSLITYGDEVTLAKPRVQVIFI
jgi:hypothetical protein